jgi:hypothetical protein
MREPHVRFCERHGGVISRAYSTPLETIYSLFDNLGPALRLQAERRNPELSSSTPGAQHGGLPSI